MNRSVRKQTGLRLGWITLIGVMLGFFGIFVFGPDVQPATPDPDAQRNAPALLETLSDAPTRRAVEALRAASPATFAQLQTEAAFALKDGADQNTLANLTLQALFGEFQNQAVVFRSAQSAEYHAIIAELANGLRELKAHDSDWCEGRQIAAYLAQNESDLVPTLLAEFPYQSPQYDWAMDWMSVILVTAKSAQDRPVANSRPGFRDEAALQQAGLALGSEQWGLALQIAAFANSEGTSYAKMDEVVSGMDVCGLGIAVETVSERLPDDIRARIWADLMPEIMIGNTPYVMWRITDYFFIG
ncbi:MAG: hypothetical protein AAF437_03905 [Pseudomonadota bacterium]